MFGAAARNFGPVHKFELPTVIADSVPRATRVFSLASAVFEIALSTLVDIRSTNELTFGGPALILVDQRNMQ